jgi:anti-sigma-K factor RskA
MNSHGQIESDLPLYALGALDEPARELVDKHLAGCAECRRELLQLRGDMALLGLSAAGTAPLRVRERLLAAISCGTCAVRNNAMRWWTLIPAAMALVLFVASFGLWHQNRTLRQNLVLAHTQSDQDRASVDRARQILAVLAASDAVRITLAAPNASPQGRVIYSPRSGGLVFLASEFAPVPPGKVYELWLLPGGDTPPIPGGVFKADSSGAASVLMPSLPRDVVAKAFAITVEPETGSTAPTLPFVLSSGG